MGGVIGGNAISPNFGNGGGGVVLTQRFEANQIAPLVIPIGTESANAIILRLIQFTKTVGSLDARIAFLDTFVTVQIGTTAGAGSANFAIQESKDNIVWNDIRDSSRTGSILLRRSILGETFSDTGTFFIRMALFNSDATTEGIVEFLKGYIETLLPSGYTFEVLI